MGPEMTRFRTSRDGPPGGAHHAKGRSERMCDSLSKSELTST